MPTNDYTTRISRIILTRISYIVDLASTLWTLTFITIFFSIQFFICFVKREVQKHFNRNSKKK